MQSRYKLYFELSGLPKTINALGRAHWGAKCKESNYWRDAVKSAVYRQRPDIPLNAAELKLTRYSSNYCDADGLVSSFKHVIDGLIDARIIKDDSWKIIGMPQYDQKKAPRSKGYISVEVRQCAGHSK